MYLRKPNMETSVPHGKIQAHLNVIYDPDCLLMSSVKTKDPDKMLSCFKVSRSKIDGKTPVDLSFLATIEGKICGSKIGNCFNMAAIANQLAQQRSCAVF